LRLPASLSAGGKLPVSISISSVMSQPGVTIAVGN
jgi:hypothetical protein